MHFGYFTNFLDLSHHFYQFQLMLTELLPCSIARRGPSKTVSFIYNRTKTFSGGIFSVIKPCHSTTSHSNCLRTCKHLCHNTGQFCILQPFLAAFYCNLPALGNSYSDSRWLNLRFFWLFANFPLPFCVVLICLLIVVFLLDCCCWFHLIPLFAKVCH